MIFIYRIEATPRDLRKKNGVATVVFSHGERRLRWRTRVRVTSPIPRFGNGIGKCLLLVESADGDCGLVGATMHTLFCPALGYGGSSAEEGTMDALAKRLGQQLKTHLETKKSTWALKTKNWLRKFWVAS